MKGKWWKTFNNISKVITSPEAEDHGFSQR